MESIFTALRDMALVQRSGGGTGFSFGWLRPAGDLIAATGGTSSGPVSIMQIFDCATENIKLVGKRRGANMGVLPVDHPDILAFIDAKRTEGVFRNFNLSVGINDAPSLHAADVGISVATAVDVAKDAAAIILLERSLQVLHDGIIEGRKALGNVIKYLLMGTSSNFGNMFSMAGAFVFLPFLPMLPMQILLNNFLYDLAQVTIPTDNVDASFIQKPQHWNINLILDFMVFIGPISSIYDFLTFFVMLWVFHASESLFHTGWFVESLATQTPVLFIIRTASNPLRSRPSLPLAITTLIVVALGIILPYTPLAVDLGFTPLPGLYFLFLAGMTITYLLLVELVKRRLMRRLSQ